MEASSPIAQMTLPQLRRSFLMQFQMLSSFRKRIDNVAVGSLSDEACAGMLHEWDTLIANCEATEERIQELEEAEREAAEAVAWPTRDDA